MKLNDKALLELGKIDLKIAQTDLRIQQLKMNYDALAGQKKKLETQFTGATNKAIKTPKGKQLDLNLETGEYKFVDKKKE